MNPRAVDAGGAAARVADARTAAAGAATAAAPSALPAVAPLGRAGVVVTAYLLLVGAACAGWHLFDGGAPVDAWPCALPPLLGAVFALTSQADRDQYSSRLMVAAMMAPILLLFWSLDGPLRLGLGLALALLFAVLHAATFVAVLRWMARLTTRLWPVAGTRAVPVGDLIRRLASLRRELPMLAVQRDAAGTLVQLRWQPTDTPDRTHCVTLAPCPEQGAVIVRESLSATDAAPSTADEASMRSHGDPAFDPTRPDAQRVWNRTVQATMLDAAAVAAQPFAFDGDGLRWTTPSAPRLADDKALMTLLAAVVTRSGWGWRPLL